MLTCEYSLIHQYKSLKINHHTQLCCINSFTQPCSLFKVEKTFFKKHIGVTKYIYLFFLIKNVVYFYFFIAECGQVEVTLCCNARASHYSGFSCCGAWTLGCSASVLVVHRLGCPAACGTFSDQGRNLCPLHWQADSYPLYHQGSPKGIYESKYQKVFFGNILTLMQSKQVRTHAFELTHIYNYKFA